MNSIKELELKGIEDIEKAQSTQELRQLETHYLGKQGLLTLKMRDLGQLPPEQKPAFGKAINELKVRLGELIEAKISGLKSSERHEQFIQERIDVTMPSQNLYRGRKHVLQQTFDKIKRVFTGLGFEYVESPELEEFKYNFTDLNYPPDHPAMDEQDTFYVNDHLLLRTQCTSVQPHIYETRKPPLKAFTVGRCFRNEALDRTHSHTFHQVDAFMIDEGISMAHLKGTLKLFAQAMFGPDVTLRFRPDFFPFVEPGVDYAVSASHFNNGEWLELGGAGLIHPSILESFGIDTERYSGWAFGLGVDRIPMLANGIDDLRYFLENDLRFLEQF